MTDLTPEELARVKDILEQFVPDRDVLVFGSRATGMAHPHSDLDIVIMGDEPLDLLQRALLREAFEESELPFRVDFAEWARTDECFRAIILHTAILLRAAKKQTQDEEPGQP